MTQTLCEVFKKAIRDEQEIASSGQYIPLIPMSSEVIQVDLGGHLAFLLNQHFKPMVLINHDIHPFDGEWNVIPYSFVNYKQNVMIS